MDLRVVSTDNEYEQWRAVRIAVVPAERCDTVEQLRRDDTPERLFLLAYRDGVLVGSGAADRSETARGGWVAPRVLPEFRRQGIGSAILRALAEHVGTLGIADIVASADDPGALAFAHRFGFVETDRQIEQLRTVGDEPMPPGPPAGIDIVTVAERPELWAACYERFGTEALGDFALDTPMQISAEQWNRYWAGDPMFLAVHDGEVIGCAGLEVDADRPERAECALTAVRRDWRDRGIASYLKRLTLHWAAGHGITELYTWTQRRNDEMRQLNEHLGYVPGQVSVTLSHPVPL